MQELSGNQRIVFLDRKTIDADFRAPITPHTWIDYPFTQPHETRKRLAEATIAVTNKVRVDEAVLADLPKLRFIAVAATGVDAVDLPACTRRGILVSNARNYAADAVAEHTMALILALSKNLLPYVRDVQEGIWSQSEVFCLTDRKIRSLAGSVLGVIGYGSIGQAVAHRAQAFQMSALIGERRGRSTRPGRVPFETVLKEADVLTLHVPLTRDTRNLLGSSEFDQIKPGALLVNTARGGLVDQDALIAALNKGKLGGAALDVLSEEPPNQDHELLKPRNDLLVTPHVAWRSDAAQQALADQVVDNINGFLRGRPINLVKETSS